MITQSNPTITVVDIGASGGLPSMFCNRENIRAVLFEPDARAVNTCHKTCAETIYIDTLLSDRFGQTLFNLTTDQECSSCLYPNEHITNRFPNPARFHVNKSILVPCDTLDSQLATHSIIPDFIKIDVQGYEWQVLQGANVSLKRSLGVILEVEFLPLYEKQVLFPEIHTLMRSYGYELYDLQRSHWKRQTLGSGFGFNGQLAFANALYLKTPEQVLMGFGDDIRIQMSAARLYSFFQYADLINHFLLNSNNRQLMDYCHILLDELSKDGIKNTPNSFFRRKLHGLLVRLETGCKILRSKIHCHETFGCSDPRLGNNLF